jgi:hypothetical protein
MLLKHQVGGHSHIRFPITTERSCGREKHLGKNHQKLAIPAGMSRERSLSKLDQAKAMRP